MTRSGGCKSTRRSVRKRQAAAGLRQEKDRRACPPGSPSLRHIQAAAGVPRMRIQDINSLLRDRLDQARLDRRLQDEGGQILSIPVLITLYLQIQHNRKASDV